MNVFNNINSNLVNFFDKQTSSSSSNYLQRKKNLIIYNSVTENITNNKPNSHVIVNNNNNTYSYKSNNGLISYRKAKSDFINNCNPQNPDYSNTLLCNNSEYDKISGLENFTTGVADYDLFLNKPDISYNVQTNTTISKSLNLSNNTDGDLIFTTTDTPTTTTTKNISYIDDTYNPIFGLDCNNLPHLNTVYTPY
jgi:hypothetical protein